ncbi:unnamed protein product, partial [Staurois parvus]
MDPQQVMFSGFPLFCTGDLISFTALVITTAVSSEGNPENMTCWRSMRTGVEKHCHRVRLPDLQNESWRHLTDHTHLMV